MKKSINLLVIILSVIMILSVMPFGTFIIGAIDNNSESDAIDHIDIEDVAIVEGTHGSYSTDYDGNKFWHYHGDSYYPSSYIVYFKDGTSKTSDNGAVWIGDTRGWLRYESYDSYLSQLANHWEVGGTYKVDCTFLDFNCSFNVKIIPTTVSSIEIEDITIMEGTHGYYWTDYEGNAYWKYGNGIDPPFTVYFKDGTKKTSTGDHNIEKDDYYYYLETDFENTETWTAGNTYKVNCELAGVKSSFNVTITETPISRIEVQDISIIEGTHAFDYTDDSGNDYFLYYDFKPSFTVYLKNGTRKTSTGDSVLIGDEFRVLNFDTYNEQKSEHWIKGHTYNVNCNFMGIEGSFRVSIIENPISYVKADDVTIIENTHGQYDFDSNDKQFYYYNCYPASYTFYFKDGTSKTSKYGDISIDNEDYTLTHFSNYDEQKSNHWIAGNTYKEEFIVAGIKGSYNVNIIENPVSSVKIEDISIAENSNGYWYFDEDDNSYFEYYFNHPPFTVHFKDGTSQNSEEDSSSVLIEGEEYFLEVHDTQIKNHWYYGNTYQVDCEFVGVKCIFNVSITENENQISSIESVSVDDISIFEGTYGSFYTDENGDQYWCYGYFDPSFTVNFRDGTSKTSCRGYYDRQYIDIDDNQYQLKCYNTDSAQKTEHWTVGNTYKVDCTFMGVKSSFNVSIIPGPVESIEVQDISIIEGAHGHKDYFGGNYWFYEVSPSFTVHFKNGTSESSDSHYDGKIYFDDEKYSLEYDIYNAQETNHWAVGNTYKVDCTFLGVESSFNVSIIPSPIDHIEVQDVTLIEGEHGWESSDEDWNTIWMYDDDYFNPKFTVYYKDGRSEFHEYDEGIMINDLWYPLEYYSYNNQRKNPWTAGNTYNVDCELAGVKGNFKVIISEKVTYNITYNLNGGKNNTANPASYTTGTEITLKNPTRSGYTFMGWYSDAKLTKKVTKIPANSTGDKTLYAKWEKAYTITYNLSSGTNNSANPKTFTATTATITLKNPTRKGYTFKGWYSDAKFKKKVTKIAKGSTGNKTLYAKWAKNTYKITYKLNSGKNNAKNPKTYTVTTATITLKNPTRKGYTFKGWYSDAKYKTKVTKISKGSTGNKTLYAKWKKK